MDALSESPQQDNSLKTTVVLITAGLIAAVVALVMGISDNPPAILLLLIGSCTLLYSFVNRLRGSKTRKPGQQFLYWAPRVLCIVFAAFISMFAMDVFGEGKGVWETTLDLMMHLIPTFVIVGVLVVSWRREWVGGVLFIALGLLYVVWAWGRFPFATYLLIAGPLAVTGILFLLNWRYRADLRAVSQV